MAPREIHSGQRFFASDLPVQPPDEEIDVDNVVLPQPVPPPPVVTIYVRKGDHPKERIISFNPIPVGVNPLDLLNAGFALDGNSATVSVIPGAYVARQHGGSLIPAVPIVVNQETERTAGDNTLTQAVHEVELALVEWLQKLGCGVKFG